MVQQALELVLKPEPPAVTAYPLPPTAELAHHNNIAGLDEWKDVACLIVVGRTQPPPFTVERDAEALTGRAVTPIAGWYPKVAAARLLDNGQTVSAERDCHPDPVAEAIRWQACEGELVQIVGRGRGVNRTAANPLDVIVMTNVVLPMPVTKLLSANDIDPTPQERMIAVGGIAFENSTHAARAYPQLWENKISARKAFERESARNRNDRRGERHSPSINLLLGECRSPLHRMGYKIGGPGQRSAVA